MTNRKHHYFKALLTLAITFGIGLYVIPWLRLHPEDIHNFIDSLPDLQKKLFAPFSCLFLGFLFFKVFSPRIAHLKHFFIRPPMWSTCLSGVILLGLYDLFIGLGPDGYVGNQLAWLVFIPLSFLFWGSIWHSDESLVLPKFPTGSESTSIQSIELSDVEDIEFWLNTNDDSNYDLLANRQVASRIAGLLLNGIRSIGIVGPFGAGKSTIIQWIEDELNSGPRKLIVSTHSCWGFKDSASSIYEMLEEAIKRVELEIDTFQIRSLPESYRKTFASSGSWGEAFSNLLLGKLDLSDQLKELSSVLSDIETTLVFVVEDLDRNDSRNFDIQEVVAFLQQLKECENISVILTGGIDSSGRIDYAKLCDHIEYLKSIDEVHISEIVKHVQERAFSSIDSFNKPISRLENWQTRELVEKAVFGISHSEAISILLNTPRKLRHALKRTMYAWEDLKGEVNFDHLLVTNVLRFGAPEALSFLIRRWDRLCLAPPDLGEGETSRSKDIRSMVKLDWESTTKNAEWDKKAVTILMKSLLPTFGVWLTDKDCSSDINDSPQGIHQEKYWRRIINESIDQYETRDQKIIADYNNWLNSPSIDSDFIKNLVRSSEYGDIWNEMARYFLSNQPDTILKICAEVISCILKKEGACASSDSQGFVVTYSLSSNQVPIRKGNALWLNERLYEASKVSLDLVASFLTYYTSPNRKTFILQDDFNTVRSLINGTLEVNLKNGDDLIQLLHEKHHRILYTLIIDSKTGELNDELDHWAWLEPVIFDALKKKRNITVVKNVASLLATRKSGIQSGPWEVNPDILFGLFPNNYKEIIDLLDQLSEMIEIKMDQNMVRKITTTAKAAIEEKEDQNH